MTQSRHIRIGVVGAGANTRARHLPGFQAIDGVAVSLVCNRSAASSEAVAREFGIPRIAGDWREVVEASDVDAICIGTWPYLHAEIARAALDAGKHVLTEARMARTVAEAEAMVAASRRHPDLVAQVVPAPMSLDIDLTVNALIAEGSLGEIREVDVTHTGGQFADSTSPHSWRQDSELSGFNTLTVGICYEIVRRWLRRDPARVLAHGRVFTKSRPASDGAMVPIEIPESVTILGEYLEGARFIGHFSGVESTAARSEIRINGSMGCIRADLANATLFLAKPGGREAEISIGADERRGWRVEADFVDSIRHGTPVSLTNFDDGLAYMRFTEAMYRSQLSGGQWMDL